MNSQVTLTKHGVVGVIEINNPPGNASSRIVRQGLLDCKSAAAATRERQQGFLRLVNQVNPVIRSIERTPC